MSRYPAGKFDRRIQVQESRETRDKAGDVLQEWNNEFKLWADRRPKTPGKEVQATGGTLRQFDLIFRVRDSGMSQRIAPETHRIFYQDRIYEIVGLVPGFDREDIIDILVSARPDQRGDRGNDGVDVAP